MKIIESKKLPGVMLIKPKVFHDHRGFFMETYNENVFNELGIQANFIQENHSLSVAAGVLRGLHYQLNPRAQAKLVRVVSGVIYDVVVDIRKGSPTFGCWQSFILSEENKYQLFVPRGFAHGFCTLVPNCEVIYKVDNHYSPEHDRGIAWNDPMLNIDWPLSEPILSEKDRKHPTLSEAENNFHYKGDTPA